MKLVTFDAICTALNDAGVRFLVAGGLAVNAHGYLRLNREYKAAIRGKLAPGLIVRFVSIPTLIKMKKLANRPKDLDDIEHLRTIAKEKRRGP